MNNIAGTKKLRRLYYSRSIKVIDSIVNEDLTAA